MVQQPNIWGAGAERIVADHRGYGLSAKLAVTAGIQVLIDGGLGGLGGLIEVYRSPARVQWSPTGTNIPDYPKLAQLWWQAIGDASSGAKSAQEAMDSLCAEQEKVLERLERAGV